MNRKGRKKQLLEASKRLHMGTCFFADIKLLLGKSTIINGCGEEVVFAEQPIFRTRTSIKPIDFSVSYKTGFLRCLYKCVYKENSIPEYLDNVQLYCIYVSSYLSSEVWVASTLGPHGPLRICGSTPEQAFNSLRCLLSLQQYQ